MFSVLIACESNPCILVASGLLVRPHFFRNKYPDRAPFFRSRYAVFGGRAARPPAVFGDSTASGGSSTAGAIISSPLMEPFPAAQQPRPHTSGPLPLFSTLPSRAAPCWPQSLQVCQLFAPIN